MTVRIVTLGCKVNQVESQALAQLFASAGIEPAGEGRADIVVVNSCTVTAEADRKTRQTVRRLRRENPDALLVLTGCMPQASPDAAAALPEADIVTGTKDRAGIVDMVLARLSGGERQVNVGRYDSTDVFECALAADRFDPSFQKAYLKIEDGCDRFCSYCIIPRARGRVRSLTPDKAAERCAALVNNGYREVILTGINLSRCGCDMGHRLVDYVEAIDALPGDFRIRLGSLEPDLITHSDWERLAGCRRLCPHFHLALQSGCDTTLARMNRHYTAAEYAAAADTVRAIFPDAGITTDIMVGFPGETDAEFEESCRFVEGLSLVRAHIFVYSPRPGTPAAAMPQVDAHIARERAKRLESICRTSAENAVRAHIGRSLSVLCEANGTGFAGNGIEVICPPASPVGQLARMKIVGINGTCAVGVIEGA